MATNNDSFKWALSMVRGGWAAGTANPVLNAYNEVVKAWTPAHPGEAMPFSLQELIDVCNAESMQAFQMSMAGVEGGDMTKIRALAAAHTDASITGSFEQPYGGKGIYEGRNAKTGLYEYFLSATGAKVLFDPALWDQGQGSNNHGEPGDQLAAKNYAHWLAPWIGAAFDAANPQL